MFFLPYKKKHQGFSLIEVLVVIGVSLIIFVGLFASFEYSLKLIAQSRAKMTALIVANDQMEYIRSLTYDAIGTVSGIPAGLLPQISTTTLNGIDFTKRILIEYIDDDADGLGVLDHNGITTDYKQAKVTVSWNINGNPNEVFLISNIVPRSIETNVGGGTLRVNVFNADIQPLPGASVRVVNNTIVPNIDVIRTTDASGIALFGGAPAGPNYEIFVTGSGYSSDQTYMATTSLPSPSTQPVAVVEANISTMNFFIDRTSELTVRTLSQKTTQEYTETFTGTTGIVESTDVTVGGGLVSLATSGSEFVPSGELFLSPFTPSPLDAWEFLVASGTVPFNTSATIRFYTSTSTADLIPDSDLPGNSIGFAPGTINISSLSNVVYPSIVIGITLGTLDTNITPALDEVKLLYLESETILAGVNLFMQGFKTIGSNASGTEVYKTTSSITTDSNGEYVFPALEWDAYTFTTPGYDIAEACSNNPLDLRPNSIETMDLVLVANSANTLRVVAETLAGIKLINAEVRLERPSFSETINASTCGQVFFNNLSSNTDYELTVTPNGYSAQTISAITIDSDVVMVIKF
jgi:prepilin-type N-terminal cleavage/methylation domain-containing protein